MAKATKITVDVNVSIPDDTVIRCLRILEMWMDDNPDKKILVDKVAYTDGYRHKIHIIWNAPAADVAPVRRGHYHKRYYYREATKSYDVEMKVCSECGFEWSFDAETGVSDYNYCPNCGAKML